MEQWNRDHFAFCQAKFCPLSCLDLHLLFIWAPILLLVRFLLPHFTPNLKPLSLSEKHE